MKDTLDSPEDFERALLRSVRADVPPRGGADALAMRLGLGAAGVVTAASAISSLTTSGGTTGSVVTGGAAATASASATKVTAMSLASKLFSTVAITGFSLGVVTTSAGFGAYEWHSANVRATASAKVATIATALPVTTAAMTAPMDSAADPATTGAIPQSPTVLDQLTAAPTVRSPRPIVTAVTTTAPSGSAAPMRPIGAELGAEVRILSTAQELIKARNTGGAQAAIERYKREFPAGAFQAEALALEVDVASAESRSADVKQLGGRFLAVYPSSPHVARVRTAMARATTTP